MIDIYNILSDYWGITIGFMGFLILVIIISELSGVKGYSLHPLAKWKHNRSIEWYKIYQQYLYWFNYFSEASPESIVTTIESNIITWLKSKHPEIEKENPQFLRLEGRAEPYLPLIKNPQLYNFLEDSQNWLKPYLDPIKEYFEVNDDVSRRIGIGLLVPAFETLEQSIYDEIGFKYDNTHWLKLHSIGKTRLSDRNKLQFRLTLTSITIFILIILIITLFGVF